EPVKELRRLLDINLSYLYQDQTFKLGRAGKFREARDAMARAANYSPSNPGLFMQAGFLGYRIGAKPPALEAFLKAKALNPKFKEAWDAAMRRPDNRALAGDLEFASKLFPEK